VFREILPNMTSLVAAGFFSRPRLGLASASSIRAVGKPAATSEVMFGRISRKHDPEQSLTREDRRRHEFASAQRRRLAADHPSAGGPAGERDDEDDRPDRPALDVAARMIISGMPGITSVRLVTS